VFEEHISPNKALKAFDCTTRNQNGELEIIGVVDPSNSILWQKTTDSHAISKLFWSSNSKFIIFYTRYGSGYTLGGVKLDLYAKTAKVNDDGDVRDANYIYVINAKTGKIVYHLDPDIFIFHFQNIPDPRKWRPTLLGAGSINSVDLTGDKLTVTETIVPPDYKYFPVPGTIPPPDWLRKPFKGSIDIPKTQ